MNADFAYLTQNPRLFRAVLDFNRFYEAPDFGLAQAGSPAARLAAELAARPRLWRGFGLEREPPELWCFEPVENRLALLPFPAIERLAAYWSAVVLADTFARTLDGQRLRHAKEVVGQDVFHYALRQGRLQLGRLRHAWIPPSAELLSDQILRYPGQKLLRLCLGLWPDDLRAAWLTRWRADAQAAKILPVAQDRAEENRALWEESWPGVEKLLFTEVAPAWQPCFS
ncbi:hypothetical protein AGMMS50256_23600 [Betaproteobacteria bacterium]|nr:hypothetical protein AGMMS50256_23600 [Betaproteobacteria bacterium]